MLTGALDHRDGAPAYFELDFLVHVLGCIVTWCYRGRRVSCTGGQKNRNVLMSHKAFHGRMIVEYLAECCERVVDQNLPGNSRAFGQWLCEQVLQGKREWPSPSNPEFGLAATCLSST